MKLKLHLMLVMLLFHVSLAIAQNGGNSSSTGIYLNAVTHDKDGTMWVGGSLFLQEGLLLRIKSTRVIAVTIPRTATIDDVCFTDLKTVYMIVDYRTIIKSVDRGRSWRRVLLSPDSNLNKITFFGKQFGWAVGNDGVIFHTTDSGENWQKQNNQMDVDLKQVIFVDKFNGWATGWSHLDSKLGTWPRTLITTHDGGETWHELSNHKTMSLRNMSIVNPQEGWAIDDDKNTVFHTIDGGTSWQEISMPEKTKWGWGNTYFLNEKQGWIIGESIVQTYDGGKSWKYRNRNTEGLPLEKISFANTKIGGGITWLMGWTEKGPDIARTFDGGKTWRPVSKGWIKKTTDTFYRNRGL